MNSYQRHAFLYAAIVAFGGFMFGLDAALIAGTVDFISAEFSLTAIQLGNVVSSPALGVLLALPFAGWISTRFGRKRAIQVVAVLYLVSAVSSALAPNYWTLYFARLLGGLAFTSIALASMYIGEISPPKFRGKLVAMTQINIVVGLSGAYFVNYLIYYWAGSGMEWVKTVGIDQYTWRFMLGSEIPFAVLWFCLLFMIPESPAWLTNMGRVADAKETLTKIMPPDEIEKHVAEMEESILLSLEEMGVSRDERRTIASQAAALWRQLKDIFNRPMRRIMIIAMTIAIAQQATGINAILFYAQTVFKQLGIGTDAAFSQAIWVGITSMVFTILGLLLVDKLGRRPLIVWGMVWIIASLGIGSFAFKQARYTLPERAIAEMSEIKNVERLAPLVGVQYESDAMFKAAIRKALGEADAQKHQSVLIEKSIKMNATLVLIAILSFIGAFHFSVGPVMWVLFSEIFPIAVRGIAIPFFTIVTSLTNYVVQTFFPWQMENLGMSTTLISYAAIVGIGLVILFFTLKETKNMSIEEIQRSLVMKPKA